jgi:hypothetical protein
VQINRRTFVLAAVALVGFAGWSAIRPGGKEIAVLRVFDGHGKDYFTSLWVVDDASGFVWIQADRPDERWLSVVEGNADVELRRRGRSRKYVASVYDTPEARAYVAPRFRAKYGFADRLREWHSGRDTIPVRLETR